MNAIELRHELHMFPELSYQEYRTQKTLKEWIAELGYRRIHEVSTGLVIEQSDFEEDDYILFRADMDALPIKEETGWEFASKNSNMHACGHDFHMATLFDLMKKIIDRKVKGNFLFVFQPAEETGGGALKIIDFLQNKNYRIKAAIALHVTDEYPQGVIASKSGRLFSSSCEVDVLFKGKAVHAAFHHLGKDSIKAAVDFLIEIYDLDLKKGNLVWFGKINGGNARNIVADRVLLEGTIRSPEIEKTEEIVDIIRAISKNIEKLSGVEIEIKKGSIYRQVEVDENLFKVLKNTAEDLNLTFMECETKLTGEDFGYFSEKYPSLMFWFGTKKEQSHGLHNPKFLPSDELIDTASEVFYKLLTKLRSRIE